MSEDNQDNQANQKPTFRAIGREQLHVDGDRSSVAWTSIYQATNKSRSVDGDGATVMSYSQLLPSVPKRVDVQPSTDEVRPSTDDVLRLFLAGPRPKEQKTTQPAEIAATKPTFEQKEDATVDKRPFRDGFTANPSMLGPRDHFRGYDAAASALPVSLAPAIDASSASEERVQTAPAIPPRISISFLPVTKETKETKIDQATVAESFFCGQCFTELPRPNRCTRCLLVHYCDQACQKTHWRQHKKWCKKAVPPTMPPCVREFSAQFQKDHGRTVPIPAVVIHGPPMIVGPTPSQSKTSAEASVVDCKQGMGGGSSEPKTMTTTTIAVVVDGKIHESTSLVTTNQNDRAIQNIRRTHLINSRAPIERVELRPQVHLKMGMWRTMASTVKTRHRQRQSADRW